MTDPLATLSAHLHTHCTQATYPAHSIAIGNPHTNSPY